MNSTFRSGRSAARRVGQLAAVHAAGQADIGDQQVDAGVGLQDLQAGGAVAGLDDAVASSSSTSAISMRTVGSSSTTSTVSPWPRSAALGRRRTVSASSSRADDGAAGRGTRSCPCRARNRCAPGRRDWRTKP